MKMKDIISLICMFGGLIVAIICVVWSIALHIQNPDMTDWRFMIEYPEVIFTTIVACIMMTVGKNTL